MRWWAHWGVQYLLAKVPGGEVVHRLMQEKAGQLRHIERGYQFDNALLILEMATKHVGSLAGLRVAEIGTGWIPAVPVALALTGCEVHTYDVLALTKADFLRRTLKAWEPRLAEIAEATKQPLLDVYDRWDRLSRSETLNELCEKTGGEYLAPVDTTSLPYDSGTYDLVLSNLAMPSIPDGLIVPVLRESVRLLKPSGWSIHRIRMTDEYAATDPNRHHLHYLTYPQQTWKRWFDHRNKCQNRWRASHFLKAFRDVGLLQRELRRHQDTTGAAYFQQVPLAPEFQSCDEEDLNTIGIDVVLQMPAETGVFQNSTGESADAELTPV